VSLTASRRARYGAPSWATVLVEEMRPLAFFDQRFMGAIDAVLFLGSSPIGSTRGLSRALYFGHILLMLGSLNFSGFWMVHTPP